VDKQEIINVVFLGLAQEATGPFIPGSWSYNKDVAPVPYDQQAARELLAEAGWRDSDSDGLLDKDGQPFSFTLVTNQGNEERLKVAQIIQRRLQEIGIEVRIRVVEWSVFIKEYVDKRGFEAVLLGWSLPREPDNFDIWHSSKTREGEFNFISYANPEVDELLVEARREFDQSKRAALYHRVHRILYEEQPYMFLYVPDSLFALSRRFRGIEPAASGIGHNFIYWWVPREEQRYSGKARMQQ
jgi:peptide/nickel transport system substrate-binding protein